MQGMNSSVETVNAAAAAIVSAEGRIQPVAAVPRRKWGACFRVYWCFRLQKNSKRISHAVLVPESTAQRLPAPALDSQSHPSALVLPFVAPPSSPASFLQSEAASMVHSPAGPPPFSLSENSLSPSGPSSSYAIGPYAHEIQLVSPPVFSDFTTEPSTAPYTPPPESVHLTTPSSPEVPYAKLLTPVSTTKSDGRQAGAAHSYQSNPGSPIGRLISPSSARSGTCSPYLEPDFQPACSSSISFPVCEPPKLADGEVVASRNQAPRHTRNGGSLLDGQITAAVPYVDFSARLHHAEYTTDHRVSFELNAEDVARRLEKRVAMSGDPSDGGGLPREHNVARTGICVDETYHDLPEKARRSLSLRLAKEFKFENVNGINTDLIVGSDWWINEKATEVAAEPRKSWSFFPMVSTQPSAAV